MDSTRPVDDILAELLSLEEDWNPSGRPDASGAAMIGGVVLLKLESFAGLFSAAAGGDSSVGGVDWSAVLAAALAPHGRQQLGGFSSSGGMDYQGFGGDGVTCLGFSVVSSVNDGLWLAAGHESGAVTVWEMTKKGPKQVAGIGDIRGRLCLHTFSNLLLRTSVNSKVLLNGQYGALLGVSHLTPFVIPPPLTASSPRRQQQQQQGSAGGSTPPPSPKWGLPAGADEAAWKTVFEGFSSLLLILNAKTLRVQEQVELMDQPVDREWGLNGGLAAWGQDCSPSVVGVGPRVYLLGQQGGVFCGRLMPWSERLKTLQDVGKFKLGLYYALRFQHQQQDGSGMSVGRVDVYGSSSSGGASTTTAAAAAGLRSRASVGLARSEGVGAEPQQLQQWMLSLMLGHTSSVLKGAAAAADCPGHQHIQQLADGSSMGSSNGHPNVGLASPAVTSAAEICVCLCLLLKRPDILFRSAFPLFARLPGGTDAAAGPNGAAAYALGAFVEAVEAAVLSNLLEGLAPEVMQALVEHFAAAGAPARVERVVLHLSISSLDLDQVIRLCEGSRLYSALTYIYNQMLDFRKPLLDLLAAVAAGGSYQEAAGYCYKLLVYLRCCFRGLAFPPGTGSLPRAGSQTDLDSPGLTAG
eukprot:gene11041-11196_t